MFRNDERSVRRSFRDRKTYVRQIRNRPPFVLTIAARTLRTAFDDVTSDRSRRELVPIIRGPIELMDHRSQRQACIGCAARDYDLRAFIQCFNDRRRAQISIRALNAIPNRAKRLIRIHVAQLNPARDQIINSSQDIVAGYNPNLQLT